MKPVSDLPVRFKADSPDFEQASQREVVRRAAENARIDGREAYTEADLANAEKELESGRDVSEPPEVPPTLGQMIATDTSFGAEVQDGHRIAPVPQEDETSAAIRLVQQGLDEADHDIRLTATDDEEGDEKEPLEDVDPDLEAQKEKAMD